MFKITIIETKEVKKITGSDWKMVGQRPLNSEDLEDVHFNASNYGHSLKDVYGYTPAVEKTVKEERTILKQEVDELDIVEVIKAINGMKS